MFNKTSLRNLSTQELTGFFDRLVADYEGLPEKQKVPFMRKLLDWNEERDGYNFFLSILNPRKSLFTFAHQIEHDKGIRLLIQSRAYTMPAMPATYKGEEELHPIYYKHLQAVGFALKAPFRDQVFKSLSKIPHFPDVITSLILDYEGSIPRDPALCSLEEKPANEKAILELEQTLEKNAKKEEHSRAKKKYFLALFAMFLLGLAIATMFIAMYFLIGLAFPIIPFAAMITFAILFSIAMPFTSATIACATMITFISLALVGLTAFQSRKNEFQATARLERFYRTETPGVHSVIIPLLATLAAASLIVFVIGLIALLPPLGLSIPILACTIVSGTTLTASVASSGFFAWKNRREGREAAQFERELAKFARGEEKQEGIPVAAMAP